MRVVFLCTMVTKTKSIVLHSVKYTDNSIIVSLFTRNHGKITCIVRGLHSKTSKYKTVFFQPLTILDIELSFKHNKNLQSIKDISIENPLVSIHENLHKQTIVLFLNEIINKTTKDGEINEALFNYLLFSLQLLDTINSGIANFHLVFIGNLTKHLGFFPQNTFSDESPYFNIKSASFQKTKDAHCFEKGLSHRFSEILNSDFTNLEKLELNRQQRVELLSGIMDYLMLHLPGLKDLKSLDILQEVFS